MRGILRTNPRKMRTRKEVREDRFESRSTKRIANQDRKFLSFNRARAFVRKLNLQGQKEYKQWARSPNRPDDIPANPARTYKSSGWIGYGDWLGTGAIANTRRKFLPFAEARALVRNLKFSNMREFSDWKKQPKSPANIPTDPARVYRGEGWKGVGDWLGTGNIAPKNRKYLDFESAKNYVQKLGISKKEGYTRWTKDPRRPPNIPSDPARVYKGKGWNGYGDWLGTGNVAPKDKKFLLFDEAREFVRNLNFQTAKEYREWNKTAERPSNIPTDPHRVYKNTGWKRLGDWLGSGRIANQNREYLPFEEARARVRSLKLSSEKEYKLWTTSANRLPNIPSDPAKVYKHKGWKGLGDWLGTGNVAPKNRKYLDFDEARNYIHSLKIPNQKEYAKWVKGPNRPKNIPSAPDRIYKNKGWKGLGDWLGSGRIANQNREYLPFEEARARVRSLKLSCQEEFIEWARSSSRPGNIPIVPESHYKDDGWNGYGDWLGTYNKWNRSSVLSFLHNIVPILPTLRPIELFAIMRQNGMLSTLSREVRSSSIIKSLLDMRSETVSQATFDPLIHQLESVKADNSEIIESDDLEIPEDLPIESITKSNELPTLNLEKYLSTIDDLVESGLIADEDTIEFLINKRVSELWQSILNQADTIDVEKLRKTRERPYFESIKKRFLAQYDGALAIQIPKEYSFKINGKLVEPNLMQRLTAYRVITNKRVGNWSGVGAGKTISAILSSRIIKAKVTVVIAFNSTVEGWVRAISEAFPKSHIQIKETGKIQLKTNTPNYVILNFEKFQQPNAGSLVKHLVQDHQIDFVVLDEIQNVKQRDKQTESLRRKLITVLLGQAAERNQNLHVLGMSATPVINNLYEGKALLELIKGVDFPELKVTNTIANASSLHEKLILNGIRYKPNYHQKIYTYFPQLDGQPHLHSLREAAKSGLVAIERVLLEAKLNSVISLIKGNTLIYSHYKTQMVPPLAAALRRAGFSTGLFTGDNKEGLHAFLNGKVDVLIGTAPIGTGIDGIQHVCNQLIVVSLPWTAAEYEQLIGRLFRQGSSFKEVEVYVPQVTLHHNGNEWSWDKLRMEKILFKKTLADAALDGIIPEGQLESPSSMLEKAQTALENWISRVNLNGVFTIVREHLQIPLMKEDLLRGTRNCGNFSKMNAKFNSANSKTTHEKLKVNPSEWYLYHSLYRQIREDWPEVPYEKIAKSLKQRPDWTIGDFGCGEAKIRELLPNKVYSFDHVAINREVIACDIRSVPLSDSILDVAVFSLSLMGLNYHEYLREAHRTIKYGGLLVIAEPIGRWRNSTVELLKTIRRSGFQISGEPSYSENFIYINAIRI